MPTLLFVNACVRGKEASRTYQVCRAFLEEYLQFHSDTEVQEVDLSELDLRPFNAKMLDERNALIEKRGVALRDFPLAWQFAAADKILIGAPYWDLSFPAILKVYIEHVSVSGVTFRYADDWLEGTCSASSLMYITTAGFGMEGDDCGYDYFTAVCQQFGIPSCKTVIATGLDVPGANVAQIVEQAIYEARNEARTF